MKKSEKIRIGGFLIGYLALAATLFVMTFAPVSANGQIQTTNFTAPSFLQATQCGPGVCSPCPPATQWRASPPAATVRLDPAVIRIRCGNSGGSGFIIARGNGVAHVMSCYHLFRDGGAITVTLNDSRSFSGVLISHDAAQDVAVVRIDDPGIAPVIIATGVASPGERYWAAGWARGTYRVYGGTFQRYASLDGRNNALMVISGAASLGMSGGPIYRRGGVVGIVTHTSSTYTYGPCFPRLRRLLGFRLPPYRIDRSTTVVVQPPAVAPPAPQPNPPIQQTPLPVAPDPPPVDQSTSIDYERIADMVVERMAESGQFRGPAGERGLPGEPGAPGADGADGEDCQPTPAPDIDAIADAVVAKLAERPLFYARSYTNSQIDPQTGEVISRGQPTGPPDKVHIGGTLNYYSELVEGAPTKAFKVDSGESK